MRCEHILVERPLGYHVQTKIADRVLNPKHGHIRTGYTPNCELPETYPWCMYHQGLTTRPCALSSIFGAFIHKTNTTPVLGACACMTYATRDSNKPEARKLDCKDYGLSTNHAWSCMQRRYGARGTGCPATCVVRCRRRKTCVAPMLHNLPRDAQSPNQPA